jgi:hypothetical protein
MKGCDIMKKFYVFMIISAVMFLLIVPVALAEGGDALITL